MRDDGEGRKGGGRKRWRLCRNKIEGTEKSRETYSALAVVNTSQIENGKPDEKNVDSMGSEESSMHEFS